MALVTKECTSTRFYHIAAKNADGTPLRARRTGKTKTWKTRPKHFKIPAKYGLYQSFYIDHTNCHMWVAED